MTEELARFEYIVRENQRLIDAIKVFRAYKKSATNNDFLKKVAYSVIQLERRMDNIEQGMLDAKSNRK
jgi:hypothetical protein